MAFDTKTFCEYFYASHYIPVAIYKDSQVVAAYSSLDKPLDFFSALLPYIAAAKESMRVFSLSELGQYGLVHVNGSGEDILVGPVFSGAVTEDIISTVASRNFIDAKETSTLATFLSAIPSYTYNQFLNLIAYINYSINAEPFDIVGHFHTTGASYEQSIATVHTQNSYVAKEENQQHGTFNFENTLLSFVRDGETEKLNQLLQQVAKGENLQEGILADTPLRQAKNLLIGLVTMVGKVGAIGGGMDVEDVYRLIDLYTQECEKAPSVDAVKLLQYNMVLDFTDRVAQSKIPQNTSKEIFTCMQYIQNHTSYSIGIDDVAQQVGKSRAHITKKFKKETGLSINDFITQSKLRDAKRLLRYSEKTLAEISHYLCFSSQAYFQTVFKKETGITPSEYRRQHGIFKKTI